MEGAERERDYYRSLVLLGTHEERTTFLREALELLVEVVRAREGYIELFDREPTAASSDAWFAYGCDDRRVGEIRRALSKGIIAEAIASGELVQTASALEDPRFSDRESVRDHGIEAVICAPLGGEAPLGVLYLRGLEGAFETPERGEQVREHVEMFVRAVSPMAEALLARARREQVRPLSTHPAFAGVVGVSEELRDVVERLQLAASLDVDLLLTGPTGVGKTMLAQATHAASPRAARPFMELNCAAIPGPLFESELFGAERGAHSTATARSPGKLEAAEGGTLFLDEVGDLEPSSQAKLLQLLQSRTYFSLGSSAPRRADVRVLAATNLDLPAAVAEGRFREDLYYRLDVLEVRVPGLADRSADVIPLALHFAREAARRHRLPKMTLSPAALRAVACAEWPGNVRQLAHRVESALLEAHLRRRATVTSADLFPEREPDEEVVALQDATRRFQRQHVLAVLTAADWNVTEAARRLDVARSHLYTLIKAHGLRREERPTTQAR